jgi:hypothetical protein
MADQKYGRWPLLIYEVDDFPHILQMFLAGSEPIAGPHSIRAAFWSFEIVSNFGFRDSNLNAAYGVLCANQSL